MAVNDSLYGSEPLQFPQPSRPIHSYNYDDDHSIPSTISSTTTRSESEEGERYSDFDNTEHRLLQILRGCLEGVDEKSLGLFKKLFSKLEKDIPFERWIGEALEDDHRVRNVSDLVERLHMKLLGRMNDPNSIDQRGVEVNPPSMGEELSHKLERFKVKTINIVNEERK